MGELGTIEDKAPNLGLPGIIGVTIAVQALASTTVLIIPAIAPEVAAAVSVPSGVIGFQISIVYFAAMIMSLLGGALVRRFGACRTGQLSMLLCAGGCLLAAMPRLETLIAASLVMGAAYGLPNPAASHLLARYAPARRRNLVFSLKQTGVPLGGMVAGLIGPPVATMVGWQAALLVVAVAALLVAVCAQPLRDRLDADRDLSTRLKSLRLDGVLNVLRISSLRRLSLAAFCFSGVQLCVMTFLVVLLVEEVRLDLVTAGLVLAVVQAAGIAGRIVWGIVADRIADGLLVLCALALIMAIAAAAMLALSADWPLLLVLAAGILLGISTIGWNGVFLAEAARLSPPGQVGSATGGVMFLTFMGIMVAPPLFSGLKALLGSYSSSYVLLVVLALVGGMLVAGARRAGRITVPNSVEANAPKAH